MSLEHFLTKLESITRNRIEKHKNDAKKIFDVYEAVQDWCDAIPYASDKSKGIREFIKCWAKSAQEQNSTLPRGTLTLLSSSDLKELTTKGMQAKKNDIMIYAKLVSLIAFILTGVGLLLYLIQQDQEKPPPAASPAASVQEKHILILVVDAKNEAVLQPLRVGGIFSDGQELYYKTLALLILKKSEFEQQTALQNLFDASFSSETKQFETDVYLVKMELSQHDPGFDANVPQITRLKAFRRLPEIVSEGGVKVSKRLPNAAYSDVGAYSNG